MKLKFTFIFFCLILSVISLNLKKKNENKKSLNGITSFLQNKLKLKQASDCTKSSYRKKGGESCKYHEQCISYGCRNGSCKYSKKGAIDGSPCACDYHCASGHCSFSYWLFGNFYHCSKN